MGFSKNRDTSKFSLGLCAASRQRNAVNTLCISSFANEEDVQSRRKFAVKEVFRGSLISFQLIAVEV